MAEPPIDTSSEAPSDASPVDPRWLRNTRLAAAALFLLLALPPFALWWSQEELGPGLVYIIFFSPMFTALGLVLWRLRSGAHKSGLSLAIATGSVVGWMFLVYAGLLIILNIASGDVRSVWHDRQSLAFLTLIALGSCVPLVLRANATKAYDALWPEEKTRHPHRQRTGLMTGFVFAGLLFFAMFSAIWPGLLRSREAANEASAVASLRTINTTAEQYSKTHQAGFPPSLAALGPGSPADCKAADLIDAALASGRKSGYIFTYTPGPKSDKVPPPDCPPGVETYTVMARPQKYGTTGTRSLFTDQTGVIRWTSQDRLATANDPSF